MVIKWLVERFRWSVLRIRCTGKLPFASAELGSLRRPRSSPFSVMPISVFSFSPTTENSMNWPPTGISLSLALSSRTRARSHTHAFCTQTRSYWYGTASFNVPGCKCNECDLLRYRSNVYIPLISSLVITSYY